MDTPTGQLLSMAEAREEMVERHLAARGIHSPQVLRAMASVPRERFVPPAMREFAYEDTALPIAEDQTISQPYIVAVMVEALGLGGGERILEIGTGSGYGAAVLGEIADEVYTIERREGLVEKARAMLDELEYRNVHVIHADGTLGWPDSGPYDGIVVTAGGPVVPESLKQQLRMGGTLVIPVGDTALEQMIVRVTRVGESAFEEEELEPVMFVPLIGQEGWEDREEAPSSRVRRFGVARAGEPPSSRATSATSRSASRMGGGERGTGAGGTGARDRVEGTPAAEGPAAAAAAEGRIAELIALAAEPLDDSGGDFADVDLSSLMDRIGDARVVLIGESTHGTSEFYRFRARISRELIEKRDFDIVAAEADWPDAARIDDYVRHRETPPAEWKAFSRFPTWMWRNQEVWDFVEWLREHNLPLSDSASRVGFYGLDLYSLYTSIDAVLQYLDGMDRDAARVARERYGCLTPWESDPATYGRAAVSGRYRECQGEVSAMLSDLMKKRAEYIGRDGERFLDAVQNARLVKNAERYYRSMYEGRGESWNLRDSHMFQTLQALLKHRGEASRAVVWAHNSHLGNAAATDMAHRGQLNVGQLCREAYGNDAYLIGMGTHTGTVAAADDWGGEMKVKRVRPSLDGSWEQLFHASGMPAFRLGLRQPDPDREGAAESHPGSRPVSKSGSERVPDPEHDEFGLRLREQRIARAIGVIYRPETERASHYFNARLADQFDEYVWFDETEAVSPLDSAQLEGEPDTYPFGL